MKDEISPVEGGITHIVLTTAEHRVLGSKKCQGENFLYVIENSQIFLCAIANELFSYIS